MVEHWSSDAAFQEYKSPKSKKLRGGRNMKNKKHKAGEETDKKTERK